MIVCIRLAMDTCRPCYVRHRRLLLSGPSKVPDFISSRWLKGVTIGVTRTANFQRRDKFSSLSAVCDSTPAIKVSHPAVLPPSTSQAAPVT